MKLEFNAKSQEYGMDGNPTATKVTLTNIEGAVYPVLLSPEAITLSNDELTVMALDKIYIENFPNRAEKEKFNEIDEKIQKINGLNDAIQSDIKDISDSIESNKGITLWLVMTLFEKGLINEEAFIKELKTFDTSQYKDKPGISDLMKKSSGFYSK